MSTKPKAWTVVNRRKRPQVDAQGAGTLDTVPMYLDPRDTPVFCFLVPEFMLEAFGTETTCEASNAQDAEDKWKRLVNRYIDHVRTAKAEPVIIVEYAGYGQAVNNVRIDIGNNFSASAFGRHPDANVSLSLTYRRAFRVNGAVHHRERREKEVFPGDAEWDNAKQKWPFASDDRRFVDIDVPGSRDMHTRGAVLDYTPELHAKLDTIIATLNTAVIFLQELHKAEDKNAMLLGIESNVATLLTYSMKADNEN